jgi:hypothetical protein
METLSMEVVTEDAEDFVEEGLGWAYDQQGTR